jgi:outer membrane protein OmpA-like peptidoglycan-associated protein
MRKSSYLIIMLAVAVGGSTACASKGYVKTQVAGVSSKVDTLSQSLEETQERTRQNEGKIKEVDAKAVAAQASADQAGSAAKQAGSAAMAADSKAGDASKTAMAAVSKADEIDKASKRLTYTVVLSEDQSNFKFGEAALPAEATKKIDDLMNQIKADPKGAYFEIEGHTDNVGPKEINDKLGMDRAEAVKKYLYEQHQIPLHRMNVISYGPDKPVAPNTNKDGRAQNRRVVIKVLI